MWTALTLLALAALHGPVAPRLASNKLPVVAVHYAFSCRTRTPPRARTPRLSDDLAVRVLNTLLDDEEKPFVIWSETGPKPLKINLDLLNHRARVLERRGDTEAALETFEYCCSIDPNDGRAWLARARIRERAGVPEEAQRLLVEEIAVAKDTDEAAIKAEIESIFVNDAPEEDPKAKKGKGKKKK